MKQARESTEADTTLRKGLLGRELLLAAALLLVGLVACFVVRACSPHGATVEVTVNGVSVGEYSLRIDGEYSLNGGTNTLVIRDGEASLVHSQCPDRRCERGTICRRGETITCLPNRVQVRVTGEAGDAPDFVSE